jgi:elongation factor Tu
MFRLTVEDIFFIAGRGLVATGKVESGTLRVGDRVSVDGREATVTGIEKFRKILDEATAGENVGLLFKDLTKDDVGPGSVISGSGGGDPAPSLDRDQLAAMQDAGLVEEPKRRKWFGRG